MVLRRVYHQLLLLELKQQHGLDSQVYSFELMSHHYQLAYLDYVRFLIGSMWGNVSPDSCKQLQDDINQGMHKRSAVHLAHMVEKADQVMTQLERQSKSGDDMLLELHSNTPKLLQ